GVWAGQHAAPAKSPAPAQVRQVSAGPGQLTVPSSWEPARLSAAGLRDLTPAKSAALSLGAGVPGWMVATIAPADHPSLVPLVLRRLLQDPLPPGRETRFGGRGAWLYAGVATRGGRALDLTVQPTTGGVLTVACISRDDAPPARTLCGGAVTSASVREATTLAPGPSAALALGLAPRVEALDRRRVTMRAKLARAESAGAQERLARRLAGAHADAAEALAPLAGTAGAPLINSLRTVASAYARLATAAAGGSNAAFSASRRDLDAEESRLASVVGSVSRRIAPEPAPPLAPEPAPTLARAAATPAPGPSPLLLLLAVASLVGALAFIHGPRALARRRTAHAGFGVAQARQARLPPRSRPNRPPRPAKALLAALRHRRPSAASETPRTPPPPTARQETVSAGTPHGTMPERSAAALRARATARRAKRAASPSESSRAKPRAERAAVPRHARPAARVRQSGPPDPDPPSMEPTAAPARPATGWICEVAWHATLRAAAFRATAARPGDEPQQIAESSPVDWPPVIPPAQRPELKEALVALEERLIAAGWTAIESGAPEWYRRRRFLWTSAEAPRPLPAPDLESEWMCDIVWKAGLRGARFQACATASGERKAFILERSPKLDWSPVLPPTPSAELVAAAGEVERALIEAGWKPAGRGAAWYARRFVWTSDEPPVAASSE
ncbi:MAG TPA: hypothetical protein VKB28_05890, partial [Solirubrobacteraceae bacterium]|nr:hypothetical protein [Solirubrobacteraceae bacterium]